MLQFLERVQHNTVAEHCYIMLVAISGSVEAGYGFCQLFCTDQFCHEFPELATLAQASLQQPEVISEVRFRLREAEWPPQVRPVERGKKGLLPRIYARENFSLVTVDSLSTKRNSGNGT